MPISNDTAPLAQFLAGQAVRAQEFLGSHPTVRGGQSGWLFRVWAPHAQAVAVMGDFNGWDDQPHGRPGGRRVGALPPRPAAV